MTPTWCCCSGEGCGWLSPGGQVYRGPAMGAAPGDPWILIMVDPTYKGAVGWAVRRGDEIDVKKAFAVTVADAAGGFNPKSRGPVESATVIGGDAGPRLEIVYGGHTYTFAPGAYYHEPETPGVAGPFDCTPGVCTASCQCGHKTYATLGLTLSATKGGARLARLVSPYCSNWAYELGDNYTDATRNDKKRSAAVNQHGYVLKACEAGCALQVTVPAGCGQYHVWVSGSLKHRFTQGEQEQTKTVRLSSGEWLFVLWASAQAGFGLVFDLRPSFLGGNYYTGFEVLGFPSVSAVPDPEPSNSSSASSSGGGSNAGSSGTPAPDYGGYWPSGMDTVTSDLFMADDGGNLPADPNGNVWPEDFVITHDVDGETHTYTAQSGPYNGQSPVSSGLSAYMAVGKVEDTNLWFAIGVKGNKAVPLRSPSPPYDVTTFNIADTKFIRYTFACHAKGGTWIDFDLASDDCSLIDLPPLPSSSAGSSGPPGSSGSSSGGGGDPPDPSGSGGGDSIPPNGSGGGFPSSSVFPSIQSYDPPPGSSSSSSSSTGGGGSSGSSGSSSSSSSAGGSNSDPTGSLSDDGHTCTACGGCCVSDKSTANVVFTPDDGSEYFPELYLNALNQPAKPVIAYNGSVVGWQSDVTEFFSQFTGRPTRLYTFVECANGSSYGYGTGQDPPRVTLYEQTVDQTGTWYTAFVYGFEDWLDMPTANDCTGQAGRGLFSPDVFAVTGHLGISITTNVCCNLNGTGCVKNPTTDPAGDCTDLHDGMGGGS